MNMNMNDVYVARERYADMRREAQRESVYAQMGGKAMRSNMVAGIIEQMRQAVRNVQAATGRLVVQQ